MRQKKSRSGLKMILLNFVSCIKTESIKELLLYPFVKRINNKLKIIYEPEVDVLSWELSKKPIDYAEEVDNMIVHFSKKGEPVFVEILGASKFLSKARGIVEDSMRAFSRGAAMAR